LNAEEFVKINPVVELEEIEYELGFQFGFEDYPPQGEEEKHTAALTMTLEAPDSRHTMALIGKGAKRVNARWAAAFMALEYLRLIFRPIVTTPTID